MFDELLKRQRAALQPLKPANVRIVWLVKEQILTDNMNPRRTSNINESFKTIVSKYEVWLSTLGFGSSVCYRFRVIDFFECLQTKNVYHVSVFNQGDIEDYFEYLESFNNKITQVVKDYDRYCLKKSIN